MYGEYRASLAFDLVSSRQKNVIIKCQTVSQSVVDQLMLSHYVFIYLTVSETLLYMITEKCLLIWFCLKLLMCPQAYTDYSDSVSRRMGFIPLPLALLVSHSLHFILHFMYVCMYKSNVNVSFLSWSEWWPAQWKSRVHSPLCVCCCFILGKCLTHIECY